jgi:hypothetical protein
MDLLPGCSRRKDQLAGVHQWKIANVGRENTLPQATENACRALDPFGLAGQSDEWIGVEL